MVRTSPAAPAARYPVRLFRLGVGSAEDQPAYELVDEESASSHDRFPGVVFFSSSSPLPLPATALDRMDSSDRLVPKGNNAGVLQGKGAKGAKPNPRCSCHEFGETVVRVEQCAIFKISNPGIHGSLQGKQLHSFNCSNAR